MKIRRVFTFGDSWPDGAELAPGELTYGRIVADYFGLEHVNCAVGGSSNESLVLQLKRMLDTTPDVKDDLSIFFVTSPARTCYIDFDGSEESIYPRMEQSYGDRAHAFFKYFHTPLQDEFRTNLSILGAQKICSSFGMKDYYIVGWSNINFNYPGIDREKIYDKTCAELFDAPGQHEFSLAMENPYVFPNEYHPNQQGHQLIADTLIKWIESEWKK